MLGTLVKVHQHALYHISIPFRLNDIKQGVQRPVGIPKRKSGVVGKTFGFMYVLVEAFILAVNIHVYGRVNHGMVHGGVKVLFYLLVTSYLYLMQFGLP